MTTFAEAGIRLRRENPGEHRAACPECAKAKPRRGDDALAVKVEPDGTAAWLCHRCGWKGALRPSGSLYRARRRPAPLPPTPQAPPATFSGPVARLWATCQPIEPGTGAADYLTGRGCALPHPEGDLRWHPALPHPSGPSWPALVARVTDAVTGAPLTLHRTWLARNGSGKAAVAKPRLLWPGLPKAGGVVRLWPDEDLTFGLAVAEGIETALTAAYGFAPIWSCLDAGNLGELPVFPGVECLTIVADHDEAGLRAADACGRRWFEAGCEVRIWKAPAEGADLNDFARSAAA